MELVAETIATGSKPPEFIDSSSYLVSMLMELCLSLDEVPRDDLLNVYKQQVVEGMCSDGRPDDVERLHLIDWIPPNDWNKRVLVESVRDGIGVTDPFCIDATGLPLAVEIRNYIDEVRAKHPWSVDSEISNAALILACIKNKCPLPPYFWHILLFPELSTKKNSDKPKCSQSRKKAKRKSKTVSSKREKK